MKTKKNTKTKTVAVSPVESYAMNQLMQRRRAVEETLRMATSIAASMNLKLAEDSDAWWDGVLKSRNLRRPNNWTYSKDEGTISLVDKT